MHNLDTLPALGLRSERPALKAPATFSHFKAQVEALLGRHDRYRRPDYADDAAEVISRLPEDPYVLAVFMEDSLNYEASAELVDILTGLWPLWLVTHETVIAEWVASQKMALLPLRSEISCISPGGESVRGVLVEVDASMARYRVQSGDTVFLLNHEDVAP